MKVEEYKTELERIDKQFSDLQRERIQLIQSYIDKNSSFVVGQKVLATMRDGKEHPSFIKSISISLENKIEYKLLKCKKDGTPSQHELWYFQVKEIKPF